MSKNYPITLEHHEAYVAARCAFLFTPDALHALAVTVQEAVSLKGYTRVLLDLRKSVGLLGEYELSQAGELAAVSVPGCKVAFVINPERNTGVVTRSASSLGLTCAPFTDDDSAVRWLLAA